MNRIGRKPSSCRPGHGRDLAWAGSGNGPHGELSQVVPARMKIEKLEDEIVVTRPTERGEDRALHGLTRTLIANMVEGVTNGFEKHLEIQGVGYRAQLKGTDLELAVGFSHPVVVKPRAGISFDVPVPTQIVVKGTTSRWSARPPPRSARFGPPSPTRARASATGTSRCGERSASAHEHRARRARRASAAIAVFAARSRHRRPAAARRLPLQPRHLRPARRRRERTDARLGELARSQVTRETRPTGAAVGKALAAAAVKAGISTCVFDRGGYLYHGRVKALAEGAREGGLQF